MLAMGCGDPAGEPPVPEDEPDAGDAGEVEPEPEPEAEPEDEPPIPAAPKTVTVGTFRVALSPAEGSIRIEDGQGEVLLESLGVADQGDDPALDRLGGYAAAASRRTTLEVETIAGAFRFTRPDGAWSRYTTITAIEEGPTGGSLTLTWDALGAPPATMRLALDTRAHLEVTWTAPQEAGAEGRQPLVSMAFKCQEGERFYGLGSQSYASEHRGWRVPIWTREQGIGKKEGAIFGFQGELEDAYAPMGWVMSSRGYGVLLGRSERSEFELCSERDDAWRLETYADTLSFTLMAADTPKGLIEKLTAITGRIAPPPPWTFAPWNDGLKSAERVRQTAATLRDNGIPSSAMWVEDWIGGEEEGITGYHLSYLWYADEERWPELPALIADLNAEGFEFLGYFNSFIRKESPMWQEGLDGDFLIKTVDGEPFEFTDPIFKQASLVDLTHPGAVEWLRGYQRIAVEMGIRGWMADFGEWLPFEAVMHDGRTGAEVHNLYPLLWQEANRKNLDDFVGAGQYTFFARSGFAWTGGGTSGLAPVVWAGDQNTAWDAGDGLKSVVPIGLNLGMTGVGVFTHDIAGYASAITPPSSKALFFRWTSLGAFTPVMRTHHGAKDEQNWAFDRDEETLAHWKRYAIEHALLYPTLMSLAMESSRTGVPMFRHMALEFPDDPEAAGLRDQYMLGGDLLVAPVLDEGVEEVEVYLPAGLWASWWTGEVLEGGQRHRVAAGLGEIPVFVRPGGMVPRLLEAPDTFTRASREGIRTLEEVEGRLELRLNGGAAGSLVLYDGTRLEMTAEAFPERLTGASVGGVALPICADAGQGDCVDVDGREIRVEGAGFEVLIEGGPRVSVQGPGRAWVLRPM